MNDPNLKFDLSPTELLNLGHRRRPLDNDEKGVLGVVGILGFALVVLILCCSLFGPLTRSRAPSSSEVESWKNKQELDEHLRWEESRNPAAKKAKRDIKEAEARGDQKALAEARQRHMDAYDVVLTDTELRAIGLAPPERNSSATAKGKGKSPPPSPSRE